MPEKKNGTEMMPERSTKLYRLSAANAVTQTGTASIVIRESGREMAMAQRRLRLSSSVGITLVRANRVGAELHGSAPAVIPNIAIEMETKAR